VNKALLQLFANDVGLRPQCRDAYAPPIRDVLALSYSGLLLALIVLEYPLWSVGGSFRKHFCRHSRLRILYFIYDTGFQGPGPPPKWPRSHTDHEWKTVFPGVSEIPRKR